MNLELPTVIFSSGRNVTLLNGSLWLQVK